MALGDRLATTKYVRPGVYIGQIFLPNPVANLDLPRIPCYVGRGSDSKILRDFAMIRSRVTNERLTFVTTSAPFRALLDFISDGRKEVTVIRDQNGKEVNARFWNYATDDDGDVRVVEMSSTVFDPSASYTIEYQSTEFEVPDKFGEFAGITGTEKMIRVGFNPNITNFDEDVDYKVITELLDPLQVLGSGTGDISYNPDSDYKGPSRTYTLIVEDEDTVSTPIYTGPAQTVGIGTGEMELGSDNDYTGSLTATYTFVVSNKSGSTFDFDWDSGGVNGTGSLAISTTNKTDVEVELGLTISLDGLADFENGDEFELTVTMTPKSVLDITWFSNDPRGASGSFTLDFYGTEIAGDFHARSRVPLENGIYLTFGDLENFEANDEFQLEAVNTDSLSWDLQRTNSEIIAADDIFYDHSGSVVGTRRTYYIFLDQPLVTEVLSVVNNTTQVAIPYVWVEGTAYITFSSDPDVDIGVTYKYRNAPQPGQGYYVTVQYKRPESEYNEVLMMTREGYRDEIGFASQTNHLGIMLDHAYESFGELGTTAVVFVKDADGDGVFNTVDYRNAITAIRYNKEITDLCVLGNISSIDTLFQVVQDRNDPFEGKETLAWIGFPNGTEIGFSDTEEGTLFSYASSLQVFGDNPARGCFIGMANTFATRTIQLEDGTTQQVTLDGSFIAGILAAMQATFDVPAESELRKSIPGYDSIQLFNDFEMQRVGALNYTYLNERNNIVTVEDIVTFDTSSSDTHEVNQMRQKQYVQRFVRRELDRLCVGVTPISVAQGISLIRSSLAGLLRQLVSQQAIAPYNSGSTGDAEGTVAERDLDPTSDIEVFRDATDNTLYHVRFWFVVRSTLKRIFGVYSVDRKAF